MLPGADLSNRQHRLAAEHAFAEVWFSQWYPFYLVAVLSGASAGFLFVPTALVFFNSSSGPGAVAFGCFMLLVFLVALPLIGAGLVDALLMLCLRVWLGRIARRAIRRGGINICIACGYMLTGQPVGTRCPECAFVNEPLG